LNQRCVLALNIESMFRVEMLKILLQQYRHEAAVRKCPLLRRLWGLSGHRSTSSIYEYTP
jgi:hypothetical protein